MRKSGFAIAEYSALRDEIVKRIEFQNNVLNWTFIIAGSLITFALQLNNGLILLLYPPIAFGLSASWEQNNLRIRQLGVYIRTQIEANVSNKGWEQYRIDKKVKFTGTAQFARDTFRNTQIGMLILSVILLISLKPQWIVLLLALPCSSPLKWIVVLLISVLLWIEIDVIRRTNHRIKTLELEYPPVADTLTP